MNRRQFLKSSSAATLIGLIGTNQLHGADSTTASFQFETIRNGVGTFKMTGGTMGWMINKEGFVVIDTQFTDNAKKFLQQARLKTDLGIDVLFNTHHHHDHTGGNTVIAPFAKQTVAHENCVIWQKKSSKNPESEICATTLFKNHLSMEVPGDVISATYYGNAHTSGDIVIHFQEADVAHVGDLVFHHHPPYIDQKAGASIAHWIEVLEQLNSQYSDHTKFIFGHGTDPHGVTGNRKDLLQMRDFLTAVLEHAQKSLSKNKSKAVLMQSMKIPGFEEYYLDSWTSAIPNALSVAYDELNKQSS